MNRGAIALLRRMPNRGDQVRLAKELDVDQGTLSKICNAVRKPSLNLRFLFYRKYRIPLKSWDEPAEESEGTA